MIGYILAALVLLGAYIYIKWVINPKKQMALYTKQFKGQGYRVIELPYNPLGITFYDQLTEDEINKGDSFYTHKNVYPTVDILIGNVLNRPNIVIMNIQLLKEVMNTENVMTLQKQKKLGQVFWYVFNRGLIGVQGQQWKHRRRLISKVLNYDFVTSHIPMMIEIIDSIFLKFQSQSQSVSRDGLSNLYKGDLYHDMMIKFTSSVIISGFLGLDSLKEQRKGLDIPESVLQLFKLSADALQDPLLLIFGQKLLKKRWRKVDRELLDLWSELNVILGDILKQFEQRNKKKSKSDEDTKKVKSLVELLLEERNSGNTESTLSTEDLIDEIKTFVIAASDTTANYLTAMLFYMFEKPEIVKKLKNEIDSVIKSNEDITVENFKKMPYLQCILSETARMFNPATNFFQREATKDTNLGGVALKKGAIVDVIYFNNSFDQNNFEKPFEFIPERWQKDEYKQKQNLTSLIFSGGSRSCIGKSLALINTKVMMIKFMQRYNHLVEEGTLNGKKRTYQFKLIYHIKNTLVTLYRNK